MLKELINEFNETLENLKCSFKLQYSFNKKDEAFMIVPANSLFIDIAELQLTDEFIKIMEQFFESRGIILSHNNDRSVYWKKKNTNILLGKVS